MFQSSWGEIRTRQTVSPGSLPSACNSARTSSALCLQLCEESKESPPRDGSQGAVLAAFRCGSDWNSPSLQNVTWSNLLWLLSHIKMETYIKWPKLITSKHDKSKAFTVETVFYLGDSTVQWELAPPAAGCSGPVEDLSWAPFLSVKGDSPAHEGVRRTQEDETCCAILAFCFAFKYLFGCVGS